jgi:hypothetical protein
MLEIEADADNPLFVVGETGRLVFGIGTQRLGEGEVDPRTMTGWGR